MQVSSIYKCEYVAVYTKGKKVPIHTSIHKSYYIERESAKVGDCNVTATTRARLAFYTVIVFDRQKENIKLNVTNVFDSYELTDTYVRELKLSPKLLCSIL